MRVRLGYAYLNRAGLIHWFIGATTYGVCLLLFQPCLDSLDDFFFCERLFQIHHIDAEIFGTVALPNKDNSLAIGGKDWIGIDEIIVGKLSLVFAVCVHHDDFGVAVSVGVENDLRTIGRKGGVRVNRWIIGQFYEVASVAVNDANLAGNAEGGHLQHRLQRQCVLRRARMRDRGYRSGFGLIAFDSRRLRP